MSWSRHDILRLTKFMDDATKDQMKCWPFVRGLRREFWGRETPDIPYDPRNDLQCSRLITAYEHDDRIVEEVTDPEDGDLVSMGHGKYGRHVGIYADLDGGLVLHADEKDGAVATSLPRLNWSRVKFFRWL